MKTLAYVTFRLGDDTFAVPVTQVREVLDLETIRTLPLAPEHVLGLIDLRGTGVPVVDLRSKFGLPAGSPGPQARILVLELEFEGRACLVGGLADAVLEVLELAETDTAPAPRVGQPWKKEIIAGLAHRDGAYVILLDLVGVFRETELRNLSGEGAEAVREVSV